MSQRCERKVEERHDRRRKEVEKRHEERKKKCKKYGWWAPRGWVCKIKTIISYIIEVVWETIVTLVETIVCWVEEVIEFVKGLLATLFPRNYRIDASHDGRTLPSTPRLTAEAFSMAAVKDPAHYVDSGKRYLFRLTDGVAEFSEDDGQNWRAIIPDGRNSPRTRAFTKTRDVAETAPPKFDMIAANGGRVFAKEAGKDNFYFAMMDEMFRKFHYDSHNLAPSSSDPVLSLYVKIDPEINAPGNNVNDKLDHVPSQEMNHPASERWSIFRIMAANSDAMPVGLLPRWWQLIDARPPWDGIDPPAGLPRYVHVEYVATTGGLGSLFTPNHLEKKSIRAREVLDIGVGHCGWYEQGDWGHGGELDALDGYNTFLQLGKSVYRFFNGPVDDRGGFIDGTCNLYVLARLKTAGQADEDPENEFGILWLDEQSYPLERWRLLDPEDNRFAGTRDLIPCAVVQLLEKEPDNPRLPFHWPRYWCPFRTGAITKHSRMAVSRQVIAVTGKYDGEALLFTINFSWGTIDRTWRWRHLPNATVKYFDDAQVATGKRDIKPDQTTPTTVWPQTISMREDMTISMHGTRELGGKATIGRWFRSYAPVSSYKHGEERLIDPGPSSQSSYANPRRPGSPMGTTDEWQFLPEPVCQGADRFSHWGVYAKVDARSRSYTVQFPDGTGNANEGTEWAENSKELSISTLRLNWDVTRLLDADGIGDVFDVLFSPPVTWQLNPPSLFLDDRSVDKDGKCKPRLRLLRREPFGWIAVHADKRDDDLESFSPQGNAHEVTLRRVDPDDHSRDITVKAVLKKHVRVFLRPLVRHAAVSLKRAPNGNIAEATVEFESPLNGTELEQNVWKVRIAALENGATPSARIIFDRQREGNFTPVSGHSQRHRFRWEPTTNEAADLLQYCTAVGRIRYGTSIWFEDIVGHVATAETMSFPTMES